MSLKVGLGLFAWGGIEPAAHDGIFAEFTHPANGDIHWAHRVVYDDALIERSRSVHASTALRGGADVIVQLDHDIQWVPGDLAALARKAAAVNGIVAGLYACRSFRRGFSSRLAEQGVAWKNGGDALHKAEYVATGFFAISASALRRIIACGQRPDAPPEMRISECIGVDRPENTFWDIFRCISVPCTMAGYEDKAEALSEDWSACRRAAFAEVPIYVWEKPVLRHFGRHGFTVDDGLRAPRPGEVK